MNMKDNVLIPVLGVPFETRKVKGVYAIKEKAIVGRLYQVECPVCHHQLFVKAKEVKPWIEHCKQCGTKIFIQGCVAEPAKAKTEQKQKEVIEVKPDTQKLKIGNNVQSSAKLVWGSIFSRKSYILHEGKNYVGRNDQENPSDVSLGDEYVSRRSILIEVAKVEKGYTYKLTVKKCTNPVLINGQEQEVGNGIYLNYGDTIRVGNTVLAFKPVKK